MLKKGKRREMHIYLTKEGRKLAEKKILPVMEMENRIFSAMKQEESQELLRLTRKLVSLYHDQVDEWEKAVSSEKQKGYDD